MKKRKRKKKTKSKLKSFDKYKYYSASVQSPETDIDFFAKLYKSLYGKEARSFREDFCGTFLLSLEWVKRHAKNYVSCIDISAEPLKYGKKHYLSKLSPQQIKRVNILQKSILDSNLPKSEIITVSNFSYCAIKERKDLLKYFKNVRKSLPKKGMFVLDLFGGTSCLESIEEATKHKGFTYYWDQDCFDPISNHMQCYIHFKRDGEKKRTKVFSYDWRLWSLPELKDLLKEAGFSKVHVYWDVSDDSKNEDANFKKITKTDEECETWLAYLVSQP